MTSIQRLRDALPQGTEAHAALLAYLRERIEQHRDDLEGANDERVRGRIAECRALIEALRPKAYKLTAPPEEY